MNAWQQFLALKEHEPQLRQKDAADRLNIGEGVLLCDAPAVRYLDHPLAVLSQLQTLGPLQCTVRNDIAVHEKVGMYENLKINEKFAIAVNVGGIDVRLFSSRWHAALAYALQAHGKTMYSIQFFDEEGIAIQKVYLQDEAYLDAWQALVSQHETTTRPEFKAKTNKPEHSPTVLSPAQLADFHASWHEISDIHHFNGMIQKYHLSRIEAFEYAPAGFAHCLEKEAIEPVLQQVRNEGISMMIFVGNRGAVQIQTGKIHHVKRMHGWLNILDHEQTGFVLHVNDLAISEVWVVFRPTKDGIVSCIEAFDEQGDIVLTLFGERQEGQPEQSAWRHVLTQIADCDFPQKASV